MTEQCLNIPEQCLNYFCTEPTAEKVMREKLNATTFKRSDFMDALTIDAPTLHRLDESLDRWSLYLSELGHQAMLIEVYTTPKPGLVDLNNNGAHRDMDVHTFEQSASAIAPWLSQFVRLGAKTLDLSPAEVFLRIRQLGVECERDMFTATKGINTHKGMLFSLGLLCTAAGRVWQRKRNVTVHDLCLQVTSFTRGIVQRELHPIRIAKTAGERLYQQYRITGVRGEVESGFTTIRHHALPVFLKALEEGANCNTALLEVMLILLAKNQDTNLLNRGGMAGLEYAQQQAQSILQETEFLSAERQLALEALDQAFINRNLSPGGSADLLAITWLLGQFTQPHEHK